jgi:hypothetical protein
MSFALSVRLADPVGELAADYMSATGWSRSELVNTALDEWLKLQSHPGVRFVPTPYGTRIAALVGGPEIWTVAESWSQHAPSERSVENIAQATGLTKCEVESALAYWADFKDEIDADMARVHHAQRQARDAWERRQALNA